MSYVLDKTLTAFTETIWKPAIVKPDPAFPKPKIDQNGVVNIERLPIEGPENDNERFFTMIWNSAKPSRWFRPEDFVATVAISEKGRLVGDIGYEFEFVTSEDEADGISKFVVGWGME